MVVTILGKDILSGFGIHIPAFTVAGGLIVLKIALNMLSEDGSSNDGDQADGDIAMCHSIPLVAGPGALVTVILFTHLTPLTVANTLPVFFVFFLIASLIGLILSLAPILIKVLKKKGIQVVTKIMGLLVAAIGMEMILNGLKAAKLFVA